MTTDTQERLDRLRELTNRLISEQPPVLVEGDAMLVSITPNDAIIVAQIGVDDLIIRYASEAACALFGYTHAEMLGRPINELMPARFRALHKGGVAHYLATGESPIIGKFIRGPGLHASGVEIPLVILIRPGSSVVSPMPATFLATIRDERDAVVLK